DNEGAMRIWDLASGQVVATRTSGALAFSTDATLLADVDYTGQAAVLIKDVASGRQLRALPARNPGTIVFAPDDKSFAITDTSNAQIYIWSLVSGTRTATLKNESDSGLDTLAFSRDGSRL